MRYHAISSAMLLHGAHALCEAEPRPPVAGKRVHRNPSGSGAAIGGHPRGRRLAGVPHEAEVIGMGAVIVGIALLMGLAIGWALRGPARWCPRCGKGLICRECSTARGTARVVPR